ncbi:hypothetical protein CYMTET_46479 [Cymbomonas tetramitiformis]|uniref:Uncharacterized protein n=1 Tax=Cymbomonas tetramitiformis TaxID=36881 RepID=A0AAE0BXM9_9CHLO|nr:hypothetical protein CYMTET_46479 [Cymbomonas tetramitiformis]
MFSAEAMGRSSAGLQAASFGMKSPAMDRKFSDMPSIAHPSPGLSRLDRVLDLVTEHEARCREQEIKTIELNKRLIEVEETLTQNESGQSKGDEELRKDLRATQAAVNQLHQQVVKLAAAQQQWTESEHKVHSASAVTTAAEVESLARQQDEYGRQIVFVQDDLQGLRKDVIEFKVAQSEAVAELKRNYKLFLHEVLNRVGQQITGISSSITSEVSQANAKTEALEKWTRGATQDLADKLSEQARYLDEKERRVSEESREHQKQLEGALGRIETMGKERERLQRRLHKLQIEGEAAVKSSPGKEDVDKLAESLKAETAELRTHFHALQARYENTRVETENVHGELQQSQYQMEHLENALKDRSEDISDLAETFGDYIHSQRRPHRDLPAGWDSSLFSSSLSAGGLSAFDYSNRCASLYPPREHVPDQVACADVSRFDACLGKLRQRLKEAHRSHRKKHYSSHHRRSQSARSQGTHAERSGCSGSSNKREGGDCISSRSAPIDAQ